MKKMAVQKREDLLASAPLVMTYGGGVICDGLNLKIKREKYYDTVSHFFTIPVEVHRSQVNS